MRLVKFRSTWPFRRSVAWFFALILAVGFSKWIWFGFASQPTSSIPSISPSLHADVVNAEEDFPDVQPLYGMLPGEFEHHEGLMIGWPLEIEPGSPPHIARIQTHATQTILDLIANTPSSLRVIIPVPTILKREQTLKKLAQAQIPADRVEVVVTIIDSHWIRDFGPHSLKHDEPRWLISKFYREPGERTHDVLMAQDFADRWNIPTVKIPLFLEGGNLISNGEGLLITTTRMLNQNRLIGHSRGDVCRLLRQYFGAKQIVFLEPLAEEPNQHADMFATMPATDTVVLGEYTLGQDVVNHNILERNLQRLRQVQWNSKPLNIIRVPMPPRGNDLFGGTYTNVVYANEVLFVPKFGDVDPVGHAKAIEIFQQLLPEWKIRSVEASAWLAAEGSLHCLTKKLYYFPPPLGDSHARLLQ